MSRGDARNIYRAIFGTSRGSLGSGGKAASGGAVPGQSSRIGQKVEQFAEIGVGPVEFEHLQPGPARRCPVEIRIVAHVEVLRGRHSGS